MTNRLVPIAGRSAVFTLNVRAAAGSSSGAAVNAKSRHSACSRLRAGFALAAMSLLCVPALAAEPPRVILDVTEVSMSGNEAKVGDDGADLRIPFAVFDPDSETISVAAASGNQSIVANDAIRIEGKGEQRTLVVDQVQRTGDLLLTIAVYDGEQWAMEKIDLTIGSGEEQE